MRQQGQGQGSAFNWRYDGPLEGRDRQQGEDGLFTGRRRDHRDAPPWPDGYLNAWRDDDDRRIVLRRTRILQRWVILVELAISHTTYGLV